MQKGVGKFDDGFKEQVGLGGAEAFFGGEGAGDGDSGAYAGATSHLQVLGRVAYVDGFSGTQGHVAQGEAQRGGMRLAQAGIAAADAGGEMIPEVEFVQLAMNAVAISAGDKAESVAARQLSEDAAGASQEFGTMFGVMFAPGLVGGVPLSAWEVGGLIDAVPVWGIVLLEFG